MDPCLFCLCIFRGVDLDGLVGIAFVGSMCDDRSAVGVSEVAGRFFDRIVKTTAHELGHNFGMRHDNPPSKLCGVHHNLYIVS